MEELRSKHKSLQNAAHHIALECIHPQAAHGSPYHVHPYPSPVRLQHAFQNTQHSPKMFHPKGLKPHLIRRLLVPIGDVPERMRRLELNLHPLLVYRPEDGEYMEMRQNEDRTRSSEWVPTESLPPTAADYGGPGESGAVASGQPGSSGLSALLEAAKRTVLIKERPAKRPLTEPEKLPTPKGKGDPRAYVTPNDSPILGRALCLTPRGSPVPGRVSHLNEKFQDSLTLTADTDALVAKISAMFPTVSETHIKILLKKYYNREAVVISALQVEKHPITTPGPLTMSPSAVRLQKSAPGVHSALQLAKGMSGSIPGSSHYTPMTGTPHGSPSLLRPASGASSYYGARSVEGQPSRHQQSPKMKLKYLKSIFPKAEETLILDVLLNKDNNVQKASEELLSMGFPKKETLVTQKKEATPLPQKKVVTIMLTREEKNELKEKLQKKYTGIAERVISLALESVAFNEERAEKMLNAVLLEEKAPKVVKVEVKEMPRPVPVELKKGPILKTSSSVQSKFKSQYSSPTKGPNSTLRMGPKDSLLLLDYMPWTGPDPDLRNGQVVKPEGPEPHERPSPLARGPSGLAKGPSGIAKGSLYQKINKKSAKIIG